MQSKFLFYDEKYGTITTKNEIYLKEKWQYERAKMKQTLYATCAIIFSLMSILCLILGLYSINFNSFRIVGLIYMYTGLVFVFLTIYNNYYIKSKDYVKKFKVTREYKEQIKK